MTAPDINPVHNGAAPYTPAAALSAPDRAASRIGAVGGASVAGSGGR
jgi:hypothetical protein